MNFLSIMRNFRIKFCLQTSGRQVLSCQAIG
nr:MAG TPA: Proteasome regulatory subunit C-terminal [Caudoviricetes sp.]